MHDWLALKMCLGHHEQFPFFFFADLAGEYIMYILYLSVRPFLRPTYKRKLSDLYRLIEDILYVCMYNIFKGILSSLSKYCMF